MTRLLKIAVGMLHQESDSFNLNVSRRSDLDISRGDAVLARWRGTGMPLGGAIEVLETGGAHLIPTLAAVGASGGNLAPGEAAAILDEFEETFGALEVDAVLLDLHGALVGEDCPDVSGALVERLAGRLGPGVPLAASLDCHANLTPRLVGNLDVLVGYKTYPHVDQVPTGQRAASLLLRLLNREIQPCLRAVRAPMIQPPEIHNSSTGPIAPQIIGLETAAAEGRILDGTFFPTQPWLDVPDLASAVAITTDRDAQGAEQLARQMVQEWWDLRAEFTPVLLAPDEAVRTALEMPESTVMASESADAINSGAGGDNPALIRALVQHGDARGLAFICDAGVVDELETCAPGTRRRVQLGRNCDRRFAQPFDVDVAFERTVEGRFVLEGKAFTGMEQNMGGAVVLRAGPVHILAGRRPVFCSEPNLYRCAGLEPADYQIVGIKSPSTFRPNFAPITEAVVYLDIGGVASPNLAAMPWEHVTRPLYPLDPATACNIEVLPGRGG